MPEINGTVANFAQARGATTIDPLPSVGPDQRGPTCGFYALGYVLQYWFERQIHLSVDQKLTAPLPVRTNAVVPDEPAGFFSKVAKTGGAFIGSYSSLRHYGKYNKLTAYGSVFNAESIVKLAKGQGAQYEGQYDGRVVTTTGSADLVLRTKQFLNAACPIIIPFDVGNDGDPGGYSGERAHWAVIVGWFSYSGEDYFIHYHWSKYRYARAQSFADSNHNLTSNKYVPFQKYEVKRSDGTVYKRDYQGPSFSSQVPGLKSKGFTMTKMGDATQNLETNNPGALTTPNNNLRTVLEEHGFDPDNLANAGLIRKVVAIYPQRATAQFANL